MDDDNSQMAEATAYLAIANSKNFDNVGGRPERDCDGVVISGHCSFRCSKRRFCGHTGSPPP